MGTSASGGVFWTVATHARAERARSAALSADVAQTTLTFFKHCGSCITTCARLLCAHPTNAQVHFSSLETPHVVALTRRLRNRFVAAWAGCSKRTASNTVALLLFRGRALRHKHTTARSAQQQSLATAAAAAADTHAAVAGSTIAAAAAVAAATVVAPPCAGRAEPLPCQSARGCHWRTSGKRFWRCLQTLPTSLCSR